MWRRNWPNHGVKGDRRCRMPVGRWIMSVSCKAVTYLLMALVAVARSQTFTTVAITPARSADPTDERTQLLPNGEWIATAIPVIRLLSTAYDVPVNPSPRLSSLPNWTVSERYDIKAQAAANGISRSTSDSELRSRIQGMIRGLLTDRFGLVMKVEQKRMSVYAVTAARGGPKLEKSAIADEDCAFKTGPESCHYFVVGLGHPLNGKAINMDDLAHYIENWTDLPVVNRTALSGLFTVTTEGWVPMRLPPPPPNATPGENLFAELPTIFTVLGKLGLELQRQEETVPVYTVEHIERPAAK